MTIHYFGCCKLPYFIYKEHNCTLLTQALFKTLAYNTYDEKITLILYFTLNFQITLQKCCLTDKKNGDKIHSSDQYFKNDHPKSDDKINI